MTEPTPPPERPLPDDARERIRADLLAHAHDHRSTSPRWLVPAGAAAAVALVAGLGYWAISPGGSEPDGLPVTGGGSSTPTIDSTVDPSSLPSNEGTATPTPPGPDETIDAGDAVDEVRDRREVGTLSCEKELEFVLKGATLAYQVDDTSSFWVKGDRFSLCYAIDGSTTVTHPLPLDVPPDDVATYRVLSVFPPTEDGYRTIRVAGGLVPAGLEEVFTVEYTFPDGHTEPATKVTDDQGRTWWRMAYSYDDGGGNEMKKPEIKVVVRLSGAEYDYTLDWGMDTCAQANHGC
jgi:hypothetical protein